jgi:general secretion pathway protein D
MKKLFTALVLLPMVCQAQQIALNFTQVPLITFAEATYKSILNRDLIITPDVVGIDRKITINIKAVDKKDLPALLAELLATVGVQARDVNGLVKLERIAQPIPAEQKIAALPIPPEPVKPPPTSSTQNDALTKLPEPLVFKQAVAEPVPEPIDHEVYKPRYRTPEYLRSVLSFAFGNAPASTTIQDVLIVSGTDNNRAKLNKLLDAVDTKPVVLNVRMALIEFSDNSTDGFSVGGVLTALGQRLTLSVNAVGAAANFARLKSTNIDVLLGAMQSDSRFRFKTQPSLRLVDGERGRLMVGSDVPVRGALTVSKDGTPIQSIDYRPSGLVLTVEPRAFVDRVRAKVVQEVSNFSSTTTSAIDSPTLLKRQIETVVDADFDEVVVLTGLDEDTSTDGKSGLSFLPFALSKSNTKRATQLMVLLEFKKI